MVVGNEEDSEQTLAGSDGTLGAYARRALRGRSADAEPRSRDAHRIWGTPSESTIAVAVVPVVSVVFVAPVALAIVLLGSCIVAQNSPGEHRMMATPAPSGPVRKKRNFKALQLDVNQPPPAPQPEPTRLAPVPAGGGKKRPPPMQLKAPKVTTNATAADPDTNLLTVNGPNSAPPTGSASAHRMTYHTTLSTTLANLDLNSENKYHDLRNEDLKDLQELGQGNGGSVKKVEHLPTGTIMAKKVRAVSRNIPLYSSHRSPCVPRLF